MFHKLLLIILLLVSTPDIKGIDSSRLRYGSIENYQEGQVVMVVNSKEIYKWIPDYQTIIRENIKKGSARHTQLMLSATRLYKGALGKAGIPLIVEFDGVDKKLHKTEDVTKKIISLL